MLALLLATGTGAALAPLLSRLGPTGRVQAGEWFADTYRGRRIVGAMRSAADRSSGDVGSWHVTVDGRPLHLMRRADGSWMTMIDHYQSYPTPRAAARAAVDELGPTARAGGPGQRNSTVTSGDGTTGSREGTWEGRSHGLHA